MKGLLNSEKLQRTLNIWKAVKMLLFVIEWVIRWIGHKEKRLFLQNILPVTESRLLCLTFRPPLLCNCWSEIKRTLPFIHYVIRVLPSSSFSMHNFKNHQKIPRKRESKQTQPAILKSPILQSKTNRCVTCVT